MIDFEINVLYSVEVNNSNSEFESPVSLVDLCQQVNYVEDDDLEDYGFTPRVALGPKV